MSEVDVVFTGFGTASTSNVALTYFEEYVMQAFPYPALEECRRVVLQNIAFTGDLASRVRALTFTALSTEMRSFIRTLVGTNADDLDMTGIDRRRTVDVDPLLGILKSVQLPAMQELGALGTPAQHQALLASFLNSDSFNHRVSAMCTMILLAGILIGDTEGTS